jgi:hypothetical protein
LLNPSPALPWLGCQDARMPRQSRPDSSIFFPGWNHGTSSPTLVGSCKKSTIHAAVGLGSNTEPQNQPCGIPASE